MDVAHGSVDLHQADAALAQRAAGRIRINQGLIGLRVVKPRHAVGRNVLARIGKRSLNGAHARNRREVDDVIDAVA